MIRKHFGHVNFFFFFFMEFPCCKSNRVFDTVTLGLLHFVVTAATALIKTEADQLHINSTNITGGVSSL